MSLWSRFKAWLLHAERIDHTAFGTWFPDGPTVDHGRYRTTPVRPPVAPGETRCPGTDIFGEMHDFWVPYELLCASCKAQR